MKYCAQTTQDHKIAVEHECLQGLDELMIQEGYIGATPFFHPQVQILNLDIAESKVAAKEMRVPNKSMDLAFGLRDDSLNGLKKMLLVELRFNYINMRNLKRSDLIGKVQESKLIMENNPEVEGYFIFIFQTNIKAQATNRFFRMNPVVPSEYVVMDINDLKQKYFEVD